MILLLASLLFGEIKAPETKNVPVGRLMRIEVVCSEETTVLIPPSGDKIGAFQEAGAPPGKLFFQVLPYEAGNYDLVFVTAKIVNGKPVPEYAKTTIIAGTVPPKPNDNVNPPNPKPVSPDLSGLKNALLGILGGLSEPSQSANLKVIAGMFRQAATDIAKQSTIQDARIGLAAQGAAKLRPESLTTVRQKIGEDMQSRFGADGSIQLDEPLREKMKQYFLSVADLLESIA